MNEVTNRCNNCKIKDTSLDPYIWFNDLYNLNIKLKKIKAKYEKDDDEIKAHIINVLPEEYNQVRVSCRINMSKMQFKYLKKEIRWF